MITGPAEIAGNNKPLRMNDLTVQWQFQHCFYCAGYFRYRDRLHAFSCFFEMAGFPFAFWKRMRIAGGTINFCADIDSIIDITEIAGGICAPEDYFRGPENIRDMIE
jgi:hypothetical protein